MDNNLIIVKNCEIVLLDCRISTLTTCYCLVMKNDLYMGCPFVVLVITFFEGFDSKV